MYGNSGTIAGGVVTTATGLAATGVTGLPWAMGIAITCVVAGIVTLRLATRNRRKSV